MTLAEVKTGDSARILTLGGEESLRRRLLEMGLTGGTVVTVRRVAPLGDPMLIALRGYSLSLRRQDALSIEAELLSSCPEVRHL